MSSTPIFLSADFYKLSHRAQYPEKTEVVYSTWTPRSNKFAPYSNEVIFFGLQYFMQEYLIDRWEKDFFSQPKEQVIELYRSFVSSTLGDPNPYVKHLEELHDLGYLPLKIKALAEGTKVPIKVPMFTIENTKPEFFWLTNFIETLASTTLWQSMVSATLANTYRKTLDEYAIKTTGSTAGVDFQGHDFAMRGMSSEQSAEFSGAGHLLSFVGSDTIPAGFFLHKYYDAPLDATTLTSIPATEHSVMCSYGQTNELELFRHLLTNVYPTGFFSVVSDTWDFWKVVGEYLPQLKSEILARDGRLVIRPDSGDPVDILCGTKNTESVVSSDIIAEAVEFESEQAVHAEFNDERYINLEKAYLVATKAGLNVDSDDYQLNVPRYIRISNDIFETSVQSHLEMQWGEVDGSSYFRVELKKIGVVESNRSLEEKGLIECLWDIFGGTITEQGYKVLNPKIGAIYGDSITLERARNIVARLEEKGFASTNVVFGIGSFSYQYNTRDTFGFAMKATYVKVDGEERLIFKDPKTDDGTKKSLKGRVVVVKENDTLVAIDNLFLKDEEAVENNLLETVFINGKITKRFTLSEIRETVKA